MKIEGYLANQCSDAGLNFASDDTHEFLVYTNGLLQEEERGSLRRVPIKTVLNILRSLVIEFFSGRYEKPIAGIFVIAISNCQNVHRQPSLQTLFSNLWEPKPGELPSLG